MESRNDDDRPPKRARTDTMSPPPGDRDLSVVQAGSRSPSVGPAFHAAQLALNSLAGLDRNQALFLLKSHPVTGRLCHQLAAQNAPGGQAPSSHETTTFTKKLVEEKSKLQDDLNKAIEACKRADTKIKSSTNLCLRILQQRQTKLEDSLRYLRDNIYDEPCPTKQEKDAEIRRMHALVKDFANGISDDFKASIETAAKMLGIPVLPPPPSATPEAVTPREETASQSSTQKKQVEDIDAEDERTEDDQNVEEEQDGDYGKPVNPKKLYSTDFVNRHPHLNFHHRASGRWLKGLPPPDASAFTGVRGPEAAQWKKMREERDANKPKPDPNDKSATPKKTKTEQEDGSPIKPERTTPGSGKGQGPGNRKVQALEMTVRDLTMKLKDLRVKLDEEVSARKKAEAELASIRGGT